MIKRVRVRGYEVRVRVRGYGVMGLGG